MVPKLKPKLIEVALPLAAINEAARREKTITSGHPSALHIWWARRPLASARAVIWASLIDDPSGDETLNELEQEHERKRLFRILERLVKWENTNDQHVLDEAKAEIDRCFPGGVPPILDPFGGGGAIPCEAQRLGLRVLAGDLNPVAVLIQKAMVEIPPRFAGCPSVHFDEDAHSIDSKLEGGGGGGQGLSSDIIAYGKWMLDAAKSRIGHMYPNAKGPDGKSLTPIAWFWAHTVESPDPSWSGQVPLVATWTLSKKKEIWVKPVIDRGKDLITYEVMVGGEPTLKRTVKRNGGYCVATNSAITLDYIRNEGKAGRLKQTLLAVVAEGEDAKGKVYCLGTSADVSAALSAESDITFEKLPNNNQAFLTPNYGFTHWEKLFTQRQLEALSVFSKLLKELYPKIIKDALTVGFSEDKTRLRDGGAGAIAYADAVITYLAFVVDKCAAYWSTITTWQNDRESLRGTFGLQGIPMKWDFVEANPFSSSTGSWTSFIKQIAKSVERLPFSGQRKIFTGDVAQQDARARVRECSGAFVSTDPPYYDNIPYSDLSDFFYVWLKPNLSDIWPDEFATILTPKKEELVANRFRAGSKKAAEEHFESGMAEFMKELVESQLPDIPITLFYAYKATESVEGKTRSTGWDTFLQAIIDSGLQINATWPMRTESGSRLRANKSNALSSSIVLVCRPRHQEASSATRGEFISALKLELPKKIMRLLSTNIEPTDMPQSAIGPGVEIFSRYTKIVEAGGTSMKVRDALSIINDLLDEVIDGSETELDPETRFAVTWYNQHTYNNGKAGDADSIARAKNTSLSRILESGIGEVDSGFFRLLKRTELDTSYIPANDKQLVIWLVTQHIVRTLKESESQAAEFIAQLGEDAERARQLAYLLFKKASDNSNLEEATEYNGLISSWSALYSLSSTKYESIEQQIADVI